MTVVDDKPVVRMADRVSVGGQPGSVIGFHARGEGTVFVRLDSGVDVEAPPYGVEVLASAVGRLAPTPVETAFYREDPAVARRRRQRQIDPIRVYASRGEWLVDYGSYANGHCATRAEAVAEASAAARFEGRAVEVEHTCEGESLATAA